MIKTFITFTFLALISMNSLSQSSIRDYDKYIDSLIIELNALPKSIESGFPNNKSQSKYTVNVKKKKSTLVVYDDRYEPNSMTEKPDRYKTIVNISDLHPDGIIFKYNNDSTTISLMLFTANNDYSILTRNYVENSLNSKDYKDRIHFGNWYVKSTYEQLNRISKLLKICIEYKSNWTIAEKPDVHQFMTFGKKNKLGSTLDIKNQTILNASLANPALFLNAKSADENNGIVRKYIVKELEIRDIKVKRDIVGEIVISSTGEVVSFKPLNKIDIQLKETLDEIILSMPKWTPGKYKNSNLNISQLFMITK